MVSCLQSCLWSAMDACARCCGCPLESTEHKIYVAGRKTPPPDSPEYTLSNDFTRLTISNTKRTNGILKEIFNDPEKRKTIRHIRFENAFMDLETIRLVTDFSPAEGYSARCCPITRTAALVQARPDLDEE